MRFSAHAMVFTENDKLNLINKGTLNVSFLKSTRSTKQTYGASDYMQTESPAEIQRSYEVSENKANHHRLNILVTLWSHKMRTYRQHFNKYFQPHACTCTLVAVIHPHVFLRAPWHLALLKNKEQQQSAFILQTYRILQIH